MAYTGEKYFCTKENLKDTLETYGVAIIPSVLNWEESFRMVSGQWDFFEHITQNWETPINRQDKDTWKGIYNLYPMHSMLIQHWNVGQAQVSWDLRQNEKIVDIFSHFWECPKEELLVSFDGFSFNMPPEVTGRGWNRENTWYHTDQTYWKPEFECMQSWVTGLDVEEGDATLAIYEGSHIYHQEFADTFKIKDKKGSKVDWYKLSKEEEDFYKNKGCEKKKIMAPKGSLVFWDSRTIHCGVEANRDRQREKLRSVVYLCYKPRSHAMEAFLKKKRKAFEQMRTMSHWPTKGKLFGKNPRTYGNDLPDITPIKKPVLTELGKKLAGF
tara:strand:+ start:174 stop:1154 length:981 start_codon:yes stop_codon:yes gene_type:complete